MAKTFSFTVHDESLNTQGFRILTSGADFSGFRENPVMLFNHKDWEMPIGRWENVRTEGSRILADAVFDEQDEKAKEVMRKVESGFLKACSIGARVTAVSSDPSVMLPGQDYPTVTKWELREISLCTVGANRNALALYDEKNRIVDNNGDFLKLFDSPGKGGITHIKNKNMSRLTNLLKLSDSASEEAVAGEVQRILALNSSLETENISLKADKASLAARLDAHEQKEKASRKTESAALLDVAVKDGRINADGRPAWEKSFEGDFDSAKAQLSSIPRPTSVASQIEKGGKAATGKAALADMTFAEILKENRLKELKENSELYREKFHEAYGKYPA